MARKRSKKKITVKTTKKVVVVEEKVELGKRGNGEEIEKIETVTPPKKEKEAAKVVEENLTISVEEVVDVANEEEAEEIQSELHPTKSEKKQEEKAVGGKKKKMTKKRRRRNYDVSGNYKRYIHKVLKQVHPELGVSSMGMEVIDAMMRDMFERIAGEAARLTDYARKVTLSSRDIQAAVRLILPPGELSRHAVSEGTKAITNYVTAA